MRAGAEEQRAGAVTAPTVHDRMCWPTAMLEQALATGSHERELHAYLGDSEYALLSRLARRAALVKQPSAETPTVYLLPGILGSQLGIARTATEPPDLLWLDPDDVVEGRLRELHPQQPGVQPLGIVVHNYLALRMRLAAAGFRTVLFAYDWRQDLIEVGRTLAAALDADPAAQIALVGHSMGGLLARAALRSCRPDTAARVRHLIGLGTPHGGSMAAVQALRASYPVVLRLAAMDARHDASILTTQVFRYFLSLYQMLPTNGVETDFFDLSAWPRIGPLPDAGLLKLAASFHAQIAPADERFISIIGTGQRTVTAVRLDGDVFRYEVSSAGDGTVSIARAMLPGATTYSLRCEHSELPRSATVAAALVDLLRSGSTQRLTSGVTPRPGTRVYATDEMISRELAHKIDWHRLSVAERRRYLDHLSDPPSAYRVPVRKPVRNL
jgi:pimeloyl-ACP methyl ester carboxylesterase